MDAKTVYPGSYGAIAPLKQKKWVGVNPLGNSDHPDLLGESEAAKATRLLYEGAHESHVTATMMEERLETGGMLMEKTLVLMTAAAEHKIQFKNAVYKIRELAEKHPDLRNELREILGPVRAIIRTYKDDVREDDDFESSLLRFRNGGAAACGMAMNVIDNESFRVLGEKDRRQDGGSAGSKKR
jgi:hypothetical protein